METVAPYNVPLKFEVSQAKLDSSFPSKAGYNFYSLTPSTDKVTAFDVYSGTVSPANLRVQFGQVNEALNKASL